MNNPNHITFSSLDPSQKRTLEHILSNQDANLHIVYGPPGTGKSQLVVSLLEQLATSGKKVLFVSQNTEALRVIERMIRKTEQSIGYPVDGSYFSLLDMCLLLYEPAHRKLKYLREHSAVVREKRIKCPRAIDQPENITYQLSYTALDHDANYHIHHDEIGFDELMAYYLKYVTMEFAPESLAEFEHVNVRQILNLVDSYKHPELFNDFVHPRRELSLLATKNPELNLPTVREKIKKIADAISSESSIQLLSTKSAMDVVDYLDLLLTYETLAPYINIYAAATIDKTLDNIIEELEQTIKLRDDNQLEHIKLSAQLADAKAKSKNSINNITLETASVDLSPVFVQSAEANLTQTIQDLQEISNLMKEANGFASGFKYSSPEALQVTLAHAFVTEYQELIDKINENNAQEIFSLDATAISQLNTDTRGYFAITGAKKLLRKIPASFIAIDLKNHQWMEFYRDYFLENFEQIHFLLNNSNITLNWILQFNEQKSEFPLSKFGINYQNQAELLYFLDVSSRLYCLLKKYDLLSNNYQELIGEIEYIYKALKTIQELWLDEVNGGHIFKHGLQNFLNEVKNQQAILQAESALRQAEQDNESMLGENFNKVKAFLVDDSYDNFVQNIDAMLTIIKPLRAKFSEIVNTLNLPVDNIKLDRTYLENAKQVLLDINQTDCLSDFAYEIDANKNLYNWLDKLLILEHYSNDAEIADFVEHNNFISEVYSAFGEANRKYLTSVLQQDDLTYNKFTARIISAIVREVYGRSPINSRKLIRDDQKFFDDYAIYLKNLRLRSYGEGLQNIYSNCAAAMVELARQDTMRAFGKSTFEKFRDNTAKILRAFPIICATPKEVAKYLAPVKGEFDYVIFDEASQLLPGQALPSIFRAKKAVIIGDPHQMPPSLNLGFGMTSADDEEEDLGESILDLVRKQPQEQHHLKVHYRSRYNKLFEPSRHAIYAEEGIEPIYEAEPSKEAPIAIEDNLGDAQDFNGYDVNFAKICENAQKYLRDRRAHDEASKNNDRNYKTIDDEFGAIFCILFARGEVLAQFRRYLAEEETARKYKDIVDLYTQEKIITSTVTNCQGIEGLYTIIYLQYYTNPVAMWFFNEAAGAYKRLNVAITRQREGLKLLLANPKASWIAACESKLNNPHTDPNARLSAELMRSLLQNAGEDTDYLYLEHTLGDNVNHFDSPLTEQLYHKLEEHYSSRIGKTLKIYSEVGWNLLLPTGEGINQNERNIGFRIDLGIYSITEKRFILGVEMDGAAYHIGYYKEQSDYNRQQVLESKGWTLHRIWSTNWLNDEQREFERLTARIDSLLENSNQKL